MGRYPVLGITGGVGCGKSTVGRLLAAQGVAVLDADSVAHELLNQDAVIGEAVIRRFGPAVRKPDGSMNRRLIADRVFADERARRALEALLHPPALARIRDWVARQRGQGPLAALIPLLFEVGMTEEWDEVWCVSARLEVVLERLRERGWDDKAVAARQAAQWPLREKEARSDVVLENNGTEEELAARVNAEWARLLKRSA